MNPNLFISTFTLIFLAELPDKTAFATLMLSTRGNRLAVFVGVALAFLIQCSIAVLVGQWIGKLPEKPVHLGTGILFLIFAGLAFKNRNEMEEPASAEQAPMGSFMLTATRSFLVIFAAEWGDLTQLATASLAAKYPEKLTIFLASLFALLSVTVIAITLGKRISRYASHRQLSFGSAIAFGAVGCGFILESVFR